MTDQQSELDRQTSQPQNQRSAKETSGAGSRPSGVSSEAVASGLEFLFSHRHQGAWSLGSPFTCESASWVTAYVLTRLGEIPPHNLSFTQRQQVEESLNWLTEARTRHGGWAFGEPGSPDDGDSTAWAVMALRQDSRPMPQEALKLIHRCRRSDGGFAIYPQTSKNNISSPSTADVTAVCVRALCAIDAISSQFLAANLCTAIENSRCRISSAFFVSSTLMDWEPCMAPWFVVNAVRQWVEQQEAEGAWEQALLLRCRMRLQMQSAWPLAANLRRLQRQNGSWPGSARLAALHAVDSSPIQRPDEYFDEDGILATVTALSALAIGDLQPGLYFGSALPFRRL
ncbi:MAG TPA: prenyltransferase/squalene oxidase repeat-containing protein [Candidatus Angelobacter sp.]|nr:prenyltransferase/squalene oxidase repeat-containing protein [Candidatus Angelobacter sp.]